MKSPLFLTLSVVFIFLSCNKGIDDPQVTPTNPCSTVTFKTDISPIIIQTCAIKSCHVSGTGLGDYTNYTGLGKEATNGSFKKEVIMNKSMPPRNSNGPTSLTAAQLEKFTCWINAGAPNN
ncbi:MAG: hypothetical protein RLZZ417_2437 [Bacteroidota bacterium]|jgi:hypothetical protein